MFKEEVIIQTPNFSHFMMKLASSVMFCRPTARGDLDQNKLDQLIAYPWFAMGTMLTPLVQFQLSWKIDLIGIQVSHRKENKFS